MKNAFNFMFKDSEIKGKIFIYFIFVFAMNFLTLISDGSDTQNKIYLTDAILAVLFSFIVNGYWFSCIKSLREQENSIPFVNFKKDFVKGAKFTLATLLITMVLALVIMGLYMCIKSVPENIKTFGAVSLLLFMTCSVLFFTVYSLAFSSIFAKDGLITTFFRFKKATHIIKQSGKAYFKGLAMFILINIVSILITAFGAGFFGTQIIGLGLTALLMSVISSYTVYVTSYILNRSVRIED